MIAQFRLPDLGEGLPEAEIVQWLVAEGETVALNQTIAEVETAKAIVEIPSPYAGIVQGLHAAAGDVVAVGSPLVSFTVEGADAGGSGRDQDARRAGSTTDEPRGSSPEAHREPAATTPNLVGYGAVVSSSTRPRRRARSATTVVLESDTALHEAAPHDVLPAGAPEPRAERPRSTPPVRKLAKDLGLDLALIAEAHPGEAVTRAHVQAFAAAATTSPPAPGHDERVTRVPIRGVRKHTAAAMVQSAFTAPHATVFLTLDVTATTELLASLRDDRALDGHRIGLLAIVAKAVCLALGRTPAVNARWDDAAGEIIEHHYVNLGIAAATDRGLVVPVIADAERLPLVELADAIADLAATARAGRTPLAAMTGGTFTITNVGVFGVDAGTPILTPGEAGILAVGALRRTPWEHRGEIALRDVLTLSLSFDHRLVDGAEAAAFLHDVGAVLREPGRAMLLV